MPGRRRSRPRGCRSSGRSGGSAGRIAFGAPIPATLVAERELADILLTEFVPTWRVREGLAGHLPDGWRLVDLYDVWLGSPALAGQVAAADYRIEVTGADEAGFARGRGGPAGGQRVAARAHEGRLDRPLRPASAAGRRRRPRRRAAGVRSRANALPPGARHGPARGGRRGARRRARRRLDVASIVRERLILAEEQDPDAV